MNSPNDDVLAYLQACPDMLLIVKRTADAAALSKSPTPRGWTKVQELLNNCNLNEKLMYELIAGILGPETASSFFGYLKDKSFKIPAIDILLNNFEDVKPVIMDILNKNRLDILNLVIKKTVMSFELNDIHMKNLNAFLEMLPDEPGILFYKVLATKRMDDFEDVVKHIHSYDRVSDRIIGIMSA
jgi:hypothetical protein